MSLHLYRYGEAQDLPGLSVGVARHSPRGVSKEDLARRGYFDVWVPLLAPSQELVAAYRSKAVSFARFARTYRKEMAQPAARQAIRLVAAVARTQPVNLGCFCADAASCHRSVLRELILREAASLPPCQDRRPVFSSPACSMPEIED